MHINDVDLDVILDLVTGSDGNIGLAAERLNKKLGLSYNTIKEYDIQARLSGMDNQSADILAGRFRVLAVTKLYELWSLMTDHVKMELGNLKASDLVKAHSSLTNSLANMTSNATKISFDFNKEIEALHTEFPDIPIEDIKAGIKEFQLKAVK